MMLQVILSLPIILQLANAGFFLGTVSYLGDHWRRTTSLVTTTDSSANFTVVLKLFFIMGPLWLGIPNFAKVLKTLTFFIFQGSFCLICSRIVTATRTPLQ